MQTFYKCNPNFFHISFFLLLSLFLPPYNPFFVYYWVWGFLLIDRFVFLSVMLSSLYCFSCYSCNGSKHQLTNSVTAIAIVVYPTPLFFTSSVSSSSSSSSYWFFPPSFLSYSTVFQLCKVELYTCYTFFLNREEGVDWGFGAEWSVVFKCKLEMRY